MYWKALADLGKGKAVPVPSPHPKFSVQVCLAAAAAAGCIDQEAAHCSQWTARCHQISSSNNGSCRSMEIAAAASLRQHLQQGRLHLPCCQYPGSKCPPALLYS
jgi:hypothetical protein